MLITERSLRALIRNELRLYSISKVMSDILDPDSGINTLARADNQTDKISDAV
jgi:hypothetical protein